MNLQSLLANIWMLSHGDNLCMFVFCFFFSMAQSNSSIVLSIPTSAGFRCDSVVSFIQDHHVRKCRFFKKGFAFCSCVIPIRNKVVAMDSRPKVFIRRTHQRALGNCWSCRTQRAMLVNATGAVVKPWPPKKSCKTIEMFIITSFFVVFDEHCMIGSASMFFFSDIFKSVLSTTKLNWCPYKCDVCR